MESEQWTALKGDPENAQALVQNGNEDASDDDENELKIAGETANTDHDQSAFDQDEIVVAKAFKAPMSFADLFLVVQITYPNDPSSGTQCRFSLIGNKRGYSTKASALRVARAALSSIAQFNNAGVDLAKLAASSTVAWDSQQSSSASNPQTLSSTHVRVFVAQNGILSLLLYQFVVSVCVCVCI